MIAACNNTVNKTTTIVLLLHCVRVKSYAMKFVTLRVKSYTMDDGVMAPLSLNATAPRPADGPLQLPVCNCRMRAHTIHIRSYTCVSYAPASNFLPFIRVRLVSFKYRILPLSVEFSHFIRRSSASVTIGLARSETHSGYSARANEAGASLFFIKLSPGIGFPGFIARGTGAVVCSGRQDGPAEAAARRRRRTRDAALEAVVDLFYGPRGLAMDKPSFVTTAERRMRCASSFSFIYVFFCKF